MTRQVITPRFVLRPQRRTTTRCDTAPTMTLRRDASPASPGRRPAIAGSSTPPSALLSRRPQNQSRRAFQQHPEAMRFSSGARHAVVLQEVGQPHRCYQVFHLPLQSHESGSITCVALPILHIGLSNIDPQHLEIALRYTPIASVQNRCNPFYKKDFKNGLIALCKAKGVTYLPHSP